MFVNLISLPCFSNILDLWDYKFWTVDPYGAPDLRQFNQYLRAQTSLSQRHKLESQKYPSSNTSKQTLELFHWQLMEDKPCGWNGGLFVSFYSLGENHDQTGITLFLVITKKRGKVHLFAFSSPLNPPANDRNRPVCEYNPRSSSWLCQS